MQRRNHGSAYLDLTSKTWREKKNLTGKVTHRGGLPSLSDLDNTLSRDQILPCKSLTLFRPGGLELLLAKKLTNFS